jgi:hypothetical protein
VYSDHSDSSTGGNVLSHISTHGIFLKKSGFANIYAMIVKSPFHSSYVPDARFIITDKGIDDLEDELNMLSHQTLASRSTFDCRYIS